MTSADVTAILASQPVPPLPDYLRAKVSDAIAAESARRADAWRLELELACAATLRLPEPRSGQPWPSWETLVPAPRDARRLA